MRACVCGQAHQGLIVGFLMLRYFAVCTVESLSLFYLLFISRFVCTRRWYIGKLGIFYPNQTSMCLDPYQNKKLGCYRQTCLSPTVTVLLTIPRRCFFRWLFWWLCFMSVFVVLSCLFLVALWEIADLLALLCVIFLCLCHLPICILIHIRTKSEVGTVKHV